MSFNRKLLFFDSIESTHLYAIENSSHFSPDSLTCIRAYTQNAGIGRNDRSWISLPGNLLVSYVVKIPATAYPESANFLALCLYQALNLKIRNLLFKEPNDLYYEGKKCAGFLCHQSGDRLILSFGLNTVDAPEGFSTLKLDTEELFHEIDNNIYTWIPTFLREGFTPFKEEWEKIPLKI